MNNRLDPEAKIYIAGHKGLVGSALLRFHRQAGYQNIITQTHAELDLCNQADTEEFIAQHRPDYVYMAAAKVGGIGANNTYCADFIYNNLAIQNNLIQASHQFNVKKVLFLGSSCIYPREAPQPIEESSLLTGPLEPTNEWYAVAKIAGIKFCQALYRQYGFRAISVMPTNLYGPNDNFDLETSHVLPALMRRFHEAKERGDDRITLWGTGVAQREFLYVDDLAAACRHLMVHYESPEIINVGAGKDLTIAALAERVKRVTQYEGEIAFDHEKPDGTPRKCLNVSKIAALGWKAEWGLEEGLRETYRWYLSTLD